MGLEFARGQMDPHLEVLAHSVPERVDVEVRTQDGELVARGMGLRHEAVTPMSRLTVSGAEVGRANVWPGPEDEGKPVILPGGEVGLLLSWWNADDHSEWRWSIELHNRIR